MAMSKEQTLSMLRRMRAVLESSTNKAIISNIIRELENDEATIALAIHEARVELKGSDADRDDPNIEEALDILRAAVRESGQETASKNGSVGRSQEAMDARDKKNEIAELETRKQKVKDMLLLHASKDANLTETEKLTLENEALKKEANIDQLIASKKLELAQIKKENKRMGDENIVLNAQVQMSKEQTAMTYGTALAKVLMAHKGRVLKLTDAENEIMVKCGMAESAEKFTAGKIKVKMDAQPKFLFDTVTTTSDIFIPATETVLGQNNGGLFLNSEILFDLLKIRSYESEFVRDTRKINYNGTIKLPYSDGNSGADTYAEYDCADPEAIKFLYLEVIPVSIQKYLRVTFELEKMTPTMFLTYLLNEIRAEVEKLINYMVFYGKGLDNTRTEKGGTVTRNRPQFYGVAYQTGDSSQKGVSSIKKIIGASGDYTSILDAMLKMPTDLQAINPDALEGAVYTMSWLAFNELRSTKDSNGDMMFDIIRPITQFGQEPINYPIRVDTNLVGKDIVFGNPSNYIELIASGIEVFNDKDIRCRVSEYAAFTMRGGVGIPKSFIFASDSPTPRPDMPATVEAFRTKHNFRGKNS